MGEGVVSSAEGGVRRSGRLMHEQVWKRSHCYEVLAVRFRFKLDEKEERWRGGSHGRKPVPSSSCRRFSSGCCVLIAIASSTLKRSSSRCWDRMEKLIFGFDFGCSCLK